MLTQEKEQKLDEIGEELFKRFREKQNQFF
jgi:hypothetical protein